MQTTTAAAREAMTRDTGHDTLYALVQRFDSGAPDVLDTAEGVADQGSGHGRLLAQELVHHLVQLLCMRGHNTQLLCTTREANWDVNTRESRARRPPPSTRMRNTHTDEEHAHG